MIKPIVRSLLGERRCRRIEYAAWLASSIGPKAPSLRSIVPSISSRAVLVAYSVRRGFGLPRRRMCVPPPQFAKVCAIRWHARHCGLRYFVETGTYLGDTTANVASLFERCWTIELSKELHRRAQQRFAGSNVECLQGDSGEVLRAIIADLPGPSLVWLDAHASGGITADGDDPLLAELEALRTSRHVILVDDASDRLGEVRNAIGDSHVCVLKNGIVRALPHLTS